jgi:hypothetical protein
LTTATKYSLRQIGQWCHACCLLDDFDQMPPRADHHDAVMFAMLASFRFPLSRPVDHALREHISVMTGMQRSVALSSVFRFSRGLQRS